MSIKLAISKSVGFRHDTLTSLKLNTITIAISWVINVLLTSQPNDDWGSLFHKIRQESDGNAGILSKAFPRFRTRKLILRRENMANELIIHQDRATFLTDLQVVKKMTLSKNN